MIKNIYLKLFLTFFVLSNFYNVNAMKWLNNKMNSFCCDGYSSPISKPPKKLTCKELALKMNNAIKNLSEEEALKIVKECMEKNPNAINKGYKKRLYDGNDFNYSIETPLDLACEKGYVEIVKELLKYKKLWEETFYNALNISCKAGHVQIIKELLNNARYVTTEEGFLGIKKEVLKNPKLDLTNNCNQKWYEDIFQNSENRNHLADNTLNDIIELSLHTLTFSLFRYEARLSSFNPLKIACKHNHIPIVEELLTCPKIKVDETTVLCSVCKEENLELIKKLIRKPKKIILKKYKIIMIKGEKAKSYCSEEEHESFLENGGYSSYTPTKYISDSYGWSTPRFKKINPTAIETAIENRHLQIVKLLVPLNCFRYRLKKEDKYEYTIDILEKPITSDSIKLDGRLSWSFEIRYPKINKYIETIKNYEDRQIIIPSKKKETKDILDFEFIKYIHNFNCCYCEKKLPENMLFYRFCKDKRYNRIKEAILEIYKLKEEDLYILTNTNFIEECLKKLGNVIYNPKELIWLHKYYSPRPQDNDQKERCAFVSDETFSDNIKMKVRLQNKNISLFKTLLER